ncbi:HTH domain-containing protein, partial [Parasutterella excrementihominis]
MLKQNQKNKRWSKEDEQFIKDNYKIMTVNEIAKHFNVSPKAARGKIERLELNLQSLNRGLAAV